MSETFFKPFVEQAIEIVYGLVERHGIRVCLHAYANLGIMEAVWLEWL